MTKTFAPAAERNRRPILTVLRRALPAEGLVLEVASGTGQHACFFAEEMPSLHWQPSDISPEALSSIEARVREADRDNLLRPISLDVTRRPWPLTSASAVLCINMIHIAPWEATEALFAGASVLLAAGQPLITYGPYRLHGKHTAPSNAAFDESLRARNPAWGVRDIDALEDVAEQASLRLQDKVTLPANNMALVWRKITG
jgi:hypothetical protein